MTQRPVADGYIIIVFKEERASEGTLLSRRTKYYFRNMRSWNHDDVGVHLRWKSAEGPDLSSWSVIPWSAIQTVDVVTNSVPYMKLLRRFQEQHDHNWIPEDPQIDMFGQIVEGPVIEHCTINKTGSNEGCGAHRTDGVIHYVEVR